MGAVDGAEPRPAAVDLEEAMKYDAKRRKARSLIVTALGDPPLRVARKAKKGPQEMWRRLHARHEGESE